MQYIRLFYILLGNIFYSLLYAQADSVIENKWKISGIADAYFNYNLSNQKQAKLESFLCSYNRKNNVFLNLMQLKAEYNSSRLRAAVAGMLGTYSVDNLAEEPIYLRNISLLNIGYKLIKSKNLWIDLGITPSYIGFEGIVAKDNWCATRSIIADNSPYYQTGIKLNYTSTNNKYQYSFIVMNGWQNMVYHIERGLPSFGHQFVWTINKNLALNSSSFFGYFSTQTRYFHDLFITYQKNKWSFSFAFDAGYQYGIWYGSSVIARYQIIKNIFITARAERYYDSKSNIIVNYSGSMFDVFGTSVNIDYFIWKYFLLRVEYRRFDSPHKLFLDNKNLYTLKQDHFISTSFSFFL